MSITRHFKTKPRDWRMQFQQQIPLRQKLRFTKMATNAKVCADFNG
jgi:hypothetical protein